MPTYDYRCEETGKIYEVVHKMSENISTWGELCDRLNLDAEDTPRQSPVKKLATGGNVVKKSSLGEPVAPPCASGNCNPSACGIN